MRYRRVWFWAVAVCFAMFAVRSFCWLLYIDGSDLKIQSPNNLGDLSLHLTFIKNFANGVPIWPDNPIFAFSKLRYPAGIDLFNALLSLVHVDLLTGLVWVGLLASLAIFYGFYRWGGTFAVAGFLFNGGIAGFQFLRTFKFLDYQGTAADIAHKPIAWKSIALSMLVTQRGWLYAIPAGLVLLWHWREKFFNRASGGLRTARRVARGGRIGGRRSLFARSPSLLGCAFNLRINAIVSPAHVHRADNRVDRWVIFRTRKRTQIHRQHRSQRRNRWRRSPDFASEDVARHFPWRTDSQTRRHHADRGVYPGNVFCLADDRSISRSIGD